MSFRKGERDAQLRWKSETRALSEAARRPGMYTGSDAGQRNEMFLHEECSEENLLPAVRKDAVGLFQALGLDWHDGPTPGVPSNYLMDSMVYCVNALFPFVRDGRALAMLLRSIVPDAVDAEPIERGNVLAFEWIGLTNYLAEPFPGRRRGAFGTSIDAHGVLRLASGVRVGVLLEWKYTERYPGAPFRERSVRHYRESLVAADSPIAVERAGGAEALFYDPFYQLARGQLLADRMERARENGVDRVIHVLIVPDRNTEYLDAIPSPPVAQRFPGRRVPDVWRALLKDPTRFACTSFDALFAQFQLDTFPRLHDALVELRARYLEGPRG